MLEIWLWLIFAGRFSTGSYSKLSRWNFRPYPIVKQLVPNAHLLDLPDYMPTSLVFNIIKIYKHHTKIPTSVNVAALLFIDATHGMED